MKSFSFIMTITNLFTNTRGTYTCAEYDSTATVERNDACIYISTLQRLKTQDH